MTAAELPVAGDMGGVMTRGDKVFYRTLRVLLNGVMKLYFRHKVVGRDNIPKSGGFILCPVHRSYLDTPIATVITPRIMRFMGGEKFFSNAFVRWFLNAMGGFPVERSAADRGAIAIAQSILERGEPLYNWHNNFGFTQTEHQSNPGSRGIAQLLKKAVQPPVGRYGWA